MIVATMHAGNRRLDFSEHMDGFFDEIGDSPGSFAVNGLLAAHMPLVSWCHNYMGNFTSSEPSTGLSTVWSCGPRCFDRFLAMHLLTGAMPTGASTLNVTGARNSVTSLVTLRSSLTMTT